MPKVLDPPLTTRQAGQHTAAALPGARVRRAAPPFPEPQIGQVQPEDLAAAQPAQHHRRDHRPVPVRPGHPDQRHALARTLPLAALGMTRGTGFTVTSPRASRNP